MAHQIPEKLNEFIAAFKAKSGVGFYKLDYNNKEPWVTDYFLYVGQQIFHLYHNADDTWGWDVKWNPWGNAPHFTTDDFDFG